MKLRKPVWEYDLPTLAPDLEEHMIYGVAAAVVFQTLIGR